MNENTDTRPPLGRRERKRLRPRSGLAAVRSSFFAERGFDAVTVTDIADRADVDPSTFYRHFVTKEARFNHVLPAFAEKSSISLWKRPKKADQTSRPHYDDLRTRRYQSQSRRTCLGV